MALPLRRSRSYYANRPIDRMEMVLSVPMAPARSTDWCIIRPITWSLCVGIRAYVRACVHAVAYDLVAVCVATHMARISGHTPSTHMPAQVRKDV